MIPNLKLHVRYANGGLSTVDVKPRTQIAFERHFNMSISLAFTPEGMRFEYFYFMAWHASNTGVEFDDWADTVDGVDLEVAAVDPTPPVLSDGP